MSDAAIATMASAYAAAPTPSCEIPIEHYGGEMSRVGPDATAFPHRTEVLNFTATAG